MNEQFISAGVLLVKPIPRPEYMSVERIPTEVISASACICPRFPQPYAISWCATPDDARESLLREVGIRDDLHQRAIEWATDVFGEAYGWPGVFYDVDTARAARAQFFPPDPSVKVIALGLPEGLAPSFIRDATPPQSPPGYAPNGESGYLECVRRQRRLPDGGRPLGYEALNLQMGVLYDSWLCGGLEKELDVHLAAHGLIASLEDASRVCSAVNREELPAEDGPWYPLLLVEF